MGKQGSSGQGRRKEVRKERGCWKVSGSQTREGLVSHTEEFRVKSKGTCEPLT